MLVFQPEVGQVRVSSDCVEDWFECDCGKLHEPVALDGRYVRDMLSAIDGPVRWSVTGTDSAQQFTNEDGNQIHLIMPMRM